jgi:hypothetical protein
MHVRFFGKGVAVYRIKGLYAMGAACMEMVPGFNEFPEGAGHYGRLRVTFFITSA